MSARDLHHELEPLGTGQILLRGMAVVDCYRAVSFAIRNSRMRDGLTAPRRLFELERALKIEAAAVGGHDGRPQTTTSAESYHDTINTEEAAKMLGLSTRQVRRLAASLGGRRIAGRWAFDSLIVHTYAEGRAA